VHTLPVAIHPHEWKQLIANLEVREAWGGSYETIKEFASAVYGVRFDFIRRVCG